MKRYKPLFESKSWTGRDSIHYDGYDDSRTKEYLKIQDEVVRTLSSKSLSVSKKNEILKKLYYKAKKVDRENELIELIDYLQKDKDRLKDWKFKTQ